MKIHARGFREKNERFGVVEAAWINRRTKRHAVWPEEPGLVFKVRLENGERYYLPRWYVARWSLKFKLPTGGGNAS